MLLFKSQPRHLTKVLLVLVLVLLFVVPVAAQGDPILPYGEPQLGQVTTPEGTSFTFQGEANDAIAIEVAGLSNFIPVITLLDANRAPLVQETNAGQLTTISLQTTLPTSGAYFVNVAGSNGVSGQFTITLNRALPPGLPLDPQGPTQGIIGDTLPEIFYDIPLDPTNNTVLQIRSLTEGYAPQITVFDAAGTEIASFTSQRVLAVSLEYGPSLEAEILKLQISLGEFTELATFEITTELVSPAPIDNGPSATAEPSDTGSAPPATTAPVTGNECRISTGSPNTNVNARAGGSEEYAEVGQIRPGESVLATGFNEANGGWFEVQLADGTTAWVASFVVATAGDCLSLPLRSYPPLGTEDTGPAATEEPADPSAPTATPTATVTSTATVDSSAPTTAPTDPAAPTATSTATPTATETQPVAPTVTPTPSYTPTYTPSATTAVQVAPEDNQQITVQLDVADANPNNRQVVLSDVISYPGGDTADRVRYELVGFSQSIFSADVLVTVNCTGTGAENALVSPNFGRNGPQQPCNGYSRTFTHTNDSDFNNFEIYLTSGNNAYVTWTMVITILE